MNTLIPDSDSNKYKNEPTSQYQRLLHELSEEINEHSKSIEESENISLLKTLRILIDLSRDPKHNLHRIQEIKIQLNLPFVFDFFPIEKLVNNDWRYHHISWVSFTLFEDPEAFPRFIEELDSIIAKEINSLTKPKLSASSNRKPTQPQLALALCYKLFSGSYTGTRSDLIKLYAKKYGTSPGKLRNCLDRFSKPTSQHERTKFLAKKKNESAVIELLKDDSKANDHLSLELTKLRSTSDS